LLIVDDSYDSGRVRIIINHNNNDHQRSIS
jgi:hypothetical protein